jgi:SPP1 gp7 family putative phage head morphogenesis protein
MAVNQDVIHSEAVRQITLNRLANTNASKIGATINDLIKNVKAFINPNDAPLTHIQYKNLITYYETVYFPELNAWAKGTQELTYPVADDALSWEEQVFNSQLTENNLNYYSPDPNVIASAVLASLTPTATETVGDMLSRYGQRQLKSITTFTTNAFVNGMSTNEVAKKIYGGGYVTNYRQAQGLGAITRAQAFTLSHTTITQTSSQAKEALWNENKALIIGYKVVATLDSKTSTICRNIDGNEYYKKDGSVQNMPRPPLHYGCRTTMVAILDSRKTVTDDDDTNKRPSVGGNKTQDSFSAKEVKAEETYYDWLKKQPSWFQDEALGKTQGKIFRNAGLTPEQFSAATIDQFGRALSLQEMKESNKKIATYLNKK